MQERKELIEELKKKISDAEVMQEEELKQAKEEFNQKMVTVEKQLEEFKQVSFLFTFQADKLFY